MLKHIFPNWALKRDKARYEIEMLNKVRDFDAAKITRNDRRVPRNTAIDNDIECSALKLRAKARELEQNYDIVAGALNVLTGKVVGTGVNLQPQLKFIDGELAQETNQRIAKIWKEWQKKPEVTKTMTFSAAQRLAFRSFVRDGEIFTQTLKGDIPTLTHSTNVQYSFELIDADFIPIDLERTSSRGRSEIVQGIEKNQWGAPLAYWVFKSDPFNRSVLLTTAVSRDLKRIGNDRILHLKSNFRIGQTRGYSQLAPALNRFRDIQDYDEAERIAARIAANFAMFIKKGAPDGTFENPDTGDRQIDVANGSVITNLLAGEEIGMIDPNRPNSNLDKFRNGQLRAAASGLGINYSSLSQDYNGSYSAQRQGMVDSKSNYDIMRQHFVDSWILPIWEDFINMLEIQGLIDLRNIDRFSIFDCDCKFQATPWIDPKKEVEAELSLVEGGIKSKAQVQRERGLNPEEVFEQIKKEKDQEQENGIHFSTSVFEEEPQPIVSTD